MQIWFKCGGRQSVEIQLHGFDKIPQHLGAQDKWFILQTHEHFSPVSLNAHSTYLSYITCDVRVKSKIVSRSMFWAAVGTRWRNMASYTSDSLCK